MPDRKPQINFQVDRAMKLLYEEAKLHGHFVTRFCAAGLLLMVENPDLRARALDRLREWEERYADAAPEAIRAFVAGAQAAVRRGARGTPPAPRARRPRAKAKPSRSA